MVVDSVKGCQPRCRPCLAGICSSPCHFTVEYLLRTAFPAVPRARAGILHRGDSSERATFHGRRRGASSPHECSSFRQHGPSARDRAEQRYTPSFSAAIRVPSTRFLIFWKATSRASSGEPWFGLSSMLNHENPRSGRTHARQQVAVGHIGAVDRAAIATGAGVVGLR